MFVMQIIALYICYIILIFLFSIIYNISLIYYFVIWYLHIKKNDPAPLCSRTIRHLIV